MESQQCSEAQPEMKKQVVQCHVLLRAKNDMPEHWQRLSRPLDGEYFIKPQAWISQPVQVESQGDTANSQAKQPVRLSPCLLQALQQRRLFPYVTPRFLGLQQLITCL